MAVDLHTHSSYSDGSDAPTELIARAAARGLTAVALTDHDNLNGIAEARQEAARQRIALIPGVELSVDWPEGGMHLLVYWLEPGAGPLQDRLAGLQASRASRNRKIVERLRDLGIEITYEEVIEAAEGTGVGRPHFAKVLVAKGVVGNPGEAFDQYLATGRPAYVDRARLSPEEAIMLARESGSVSVVAHPHTLGLDGPALSATLRSLASVGLAGVEAWYGEYSPDQRHDLVRMAQSLGLVATGGSDYHGAYKTGLDLGVGRGDLEVPDTVIEELRAARLDA